MKSVYLKDVKKPKILVADDDPAILDALQLILEMNEYDVITSSDGQTIQKVAEERPNLLLLDIWLSGTDGRDIARKLKSQKHTRDIPIIMISASYNVEESAFNAGAEDFIPKPFELNDLLDKIEEHIII